MKDLQLFIGPNNSGKSNLLRVFEFLNTINDIQKIRNVDIEKIRFQHKEFHSKKTGIDQKPDPIEISVEFNDLDIKQWYYYKIELFHLNKDFGDNVRDAINNSFVGIRTEPLDDKEFKEIDILNTEKLRKDFLRASVVRNNTRSFSKEPLKEQIINPFGNSDFYSYELVLTEMGIKVERNDQPFVNFLSVYSGSQEPLDIVKIKLKKIFSQFIVYKPDTSYIKYPVIGFPKRQIIEGDCSNIAPYLESLLSSDVELSTKLNIELNKCIPDLKSYNFITKEIYNDGNTETVRFLRLKDRFGVDHLASDVSEGTLYFLMLLSIINQKNIPPVLMLEEPETGIHPRRITEIMEYVFKLCEDYQELSIILTTHHPYVVDHFSDIKDKVWVFDSEEGESKIRNLERDIIEPANKRLTESNEDVIDYSSSLGEHWAMGFLGGVPKPVVY